MNDRAVRTERLSWAEAQASLKSPLLLPLVILAVVVGIQITRTPEVSEGIPGKSVASNSAPSAPGGDASSKEAELQSRLAFIRSPRFGELGQADQYAKLKEAAHLAIEASRNDAAHELAVQITRLSSGVASDWELRFRTAVVIHDQPDSAYALTHIAQQWPKRLTSLDSASIYQAAIPDGTLLEPAAQLMLAVSLRKADWRPYFAVVPGYFRGHFAIELAKRGQWQEARRYLVHPNSPRSLLEIGVDRRFDMLTKDNPEYLDLRAAARREVEDWHEASVRYPRALDATVQYTYALLDSGRYQEVYDITAAVLEKLADPARFMEFYDDDVAGLKWIHDNHSRALVALGKWQQAEPDLQLAAARLENGHRDVGGLIDLAQFEADHSQGAEALKVLAGLRDGDLSPYGRMQWHGAAVSTAIANGDLMLAEASLSYLRTHESDATEEYELCLVELNRLDEAGAHLIKRLQNVDTRGAALLTVQQYTDPPGSPSVELRRARWRELVARPEVREAINRVGRVLHVPLPKVATPTL